MSFLTTVEAEVYGTSSLTIRLLNTGEPPDNGGHKESRVGSQL